MQKKIECASQTSDSEAKRREERMTLTDDACAGIHSKDLWEYCALTDAKDRITLLYHNYCHVLINHFRFAFTDIRHEV